MTPTARRRIWLGVGLLAVGIACLLSGLFPQAPLGRVLERRLKASLGPGTRVGRLHVVPAQRYVELEDLHLEAEAYSLDIPRASATFSTATLLGRGIGLEALEIQGPRLIIRGSPTEGAARRTARPGSSEAAPVALPPQPVSVKGIRLVDAALAYEPGADGVPLALDDIDATGSVGEGVLEIRVASGSVGGASPLALGPAVARLKISSHLDIDVQSAEIATARSRIVASGPLGRPGSWRPDVRLTGRLDLAEAAPLSGASMSGVLVVDGHVGGTAQALEAKAVLKGSGLNVAGWPVNAPSIEVSALTSKQPRFDASLALELLAGRLSGHTRLVGSRIEGGLTLAGLSLADLCGRLQIGCAGASGRVDGRLDVAGDINGALDARAHLEARGGLEGRRFDGSVDASGPVRVAERALKLAWTASVESTGGQANGPLPRLQRLSVTAQGDATGSLPPIVDGTFTGDLVLARGDLESGAALAGRLRSAAGRASLSVAARGSGASLTASAEMQGSTFTSLRLSGEARSLRMLASDLKGEASLDLQAAGSIERLTGTGKVTGTGLSWRGIDVGSLTAELTSRSGIGELRVDVPSLNATGQADVRLQPRPRMRGTVSLAACPLSIVRPLLPNERSLDGQVTGEIEMDVPLDKPEAADIRAHVRELEAISEPYSARATRPFDLNVRGGRAQVSGLRIEGSGAALELDGSLGVDEHGVLDLDLKLDADLSQTSAPAGWTVSGQPRARVHLNGTRQSPTAKGFVVADGLAISGPSLPPLRIVQGRVDLDGGEAVVTLDASLADGTVSLSGRGPITPLVREISGEQGALRSEDEARVKVSWKDVQLGSMLASVWPERAGRAAAALAGEAELHGSLTSLEGLEGIVTTPATAVSVQDLALQIAPFTIAIRGGKASTEEIAVSTPDGTLRVSGAVDLARRLLDLSGRGDVRLRALSPLLDEASMTGAAYLDLSVTGNLDAPRPRGTVDVHDATLRIRDIPEALTAIGGRLVFNEATARIDEASAVLGGGKVTLSGSAALAGAALSDVQVEISGRDIALRYPQGLKSRVTTDLRLTGRSGALLLSGRIGLERGLYDLDLAVQESLRAPITPVQSPFLASIGLEIRADVVSPVQVRNNLVEVGITGNLTIRGDAEAPAPFGRLEIEPGGKLFVQGRDFQIDEGRLVYSGSWDPALSLRARAEVRAADYTRYDVTVTAEGPINPPRPSFSSVPSLSEREIVSLLLTGQTSSLGLGGTAEVAGEQAAVLLAGRLSRSLSKGLQGIGIDEVRIQPELVARETDPSARFTFGKHLTQRLALVYSLSLKDPENRFIQLEDRPIRDITLLAQRRDDGSFTLGAGQRIELGGPRREPEAAEEPKTRLRDARLETDGPLAKPIEPPVGAGNKVTVFDLQDEADRLRDELRGQGFIEAEASARLDGDVAVFRVRPGPRFAWRVEAIADPPDLSREIHAALFEGEALERGRARLLEELRRRGYLRASVATGVEADDGGERTLLFTAEPGPRYEAVEVRFPGAVAISESRLLALAGGAGELLVAPAQAASALRDAYRERNYLATEVDLPVVDERAGRISITVPIREGPPAKVSAVRFEGVSLPLTELAPLVGLDIGGPYSEDAILSGVVRLRDHYLGLGYPAVRVKPELEPAGSDLTVVLRVVEGERLLAGTKEITGAARTRRALILKQIPLEPGDPLDPRILLTGERRLLDLGVFSRVAVTTSAQEPGTVHVELRELAPFALGYQFRWNDDTGASGDLEGQVRNLFGRAIALGARYERGSDEQEFRGSLVMPSFFGRGNITLTAFRTEEQPALGPDLPPDTPRDNILERGGEFLQALHLPNRWDALLGYRFMRSTITSPFFLEPISENIAALETSLLRETRDNPLNARQGRFWSLSLEYSPEFLGSSFTFAKGFGQFFTFRSVGPSLTWSQGYRIGLAYGFGGQDLVSTERFNAGGGNSVRGYATDTLGPVDIFGDPAGGDAVLIFNQELRYLHRSGFGAAAFWDAGNVFAKASDLSLSLRHALGTGLRWDSPIGLLRLDIGFPLGRREGDKAYRVFFSLGQAF